MAWVRSLDAANVIQDYRHRAEVLRDDVRWPSASSTPASPPRTC